MAPEPSDKLYRPCVGIVLFNHVGQVFVGERIDTPGAWQMPQGGLDDGEVLFEAARRELREEIGTANVSFLESAPEPLRYDLPDSLRDSLWKGRYAGQEQRWIAARFLGQDGDINLNAHDPAEFCAWQWVKLRDTLELIVPFKRPVYEKVITFFAHLSET